MARLRARWRGSPAAAAAAASAIGAASVASQGSAGGQTVPGARQQRTPVGRSAEGGETRAVAERAVEAGSERAVDEWQRNGLMRQRAASPTVEAAPRDRGAASRRERGRALAKALTQLLEAGRGTGGGGQVAAAAGALLLMSGEPARLAPLCQSWGVPKGRAQALGSLQPVAAPLPEGEHVSAGDGTTPMLLYEEEATSLVGA